MCFIVLLVFCYSDEQLPGTGPAISAVNMPLMQVLLGSFFLISFEVGSYYV